MFQTEWRMFQFRERHLKKAFVIEEFGFLLNKLIFKFEGLKYTTFFLFHSITKIFSKKTYDRILFFSIVEITVF